MPNYHETTLSLHSVFKPQQISVSKPSSSPNKRSHGFSVEDITPEIAAFVVKNYLLPMFDKESKRSDRNKRAADHGRKTTNDDEENTVYEELKLSEKLQIEIYALREDSQNLREQIESLTL
jgi:hypothetical protein